MLQTDGVRLERVGAAAVITIDRPSVHNAINRQTMDELDRALDDVIASDAKVLAVRGAGDRVFVSGGDLKELATIRTPEDAQAMALRMRSLLDRLVTLPIPVIGVLNGHAFGGGCEVAMACDFRIAAEDIKLAFNQVELGIMPAWGGIERLQALTGRGRALYLVTTGLPIDASTAQAWGLVEMVVPRATFDEAVNQVVERLTGASQDALIGIKAAADAAQPAARPDLAGEATASFARTWVAPTHWEAVEAFQTRRRLEPR